MPRFIRVDLGSKTLATTKASGEERSTPLRDLTREGGKIFLQGAGAKGALAGAPAGALI